MQTIALIGLGQPLAAILSTAARARGLHLTAAAAPEGGPYLQLLDDSLCGHAGAGQPPVMPPVIWPLPARIGSIFDWLQQELWRAPSFKLGAAGRLEAQARRILKPDSLGGGAVPLTEKEVEIIATLAGAAAPVPRDQLLNAVWRYNPEADTHTLETHIYRLRQKLEGAGIARLLLSCEAGYYLAGSGADAG